MAEAKDDYLESLDVGEERYRADFEILDRYQNFSAELLRLSLLALAGYGFLMSDVVFGVRKNGETGDLLFLHAFHEHTGLLVSGAVLLGLCALTSLAHRYFSTDCMSHHIRRVRLIKRNLTEASKEKRGARDVVIEKEATLLRADFALCRWLLIASGGLLGLGAICFAIAVALILYRASAG
ncbi:MAG TPA: hypothetical protein PLR41_16505 [Alphaproteobacteria bacterium]|nr:hypothetical protein [Alphaproteobacteria bacterium]